MQMYFTIRGFKFDIANEHSGTHQLHHYGDVGQYGAPLACKASVSRFEPGMSHKNAVGLNQRFTLLLIERTPHATP